MAEEQKAPRPLVKGAWIANWQDPTRENGPTDQYWITLATPFQLTFTAKWFPDPTPEDPNRQKQAHTWVASCRVFFHNSPGKAPIFNEVITVPLTQRQVRGSRGPLPNVVLQAFIRNGVQRGLFDFVSTEEQADETDDPEPGDVIF